MPSDLNTHFDIVNKQLHFSVKYISVFLQYYIWLVMLISLNLFAATVIWENLDSKRPNWYRLSIVSILQMIGCMLQSGNPGCDFQRCLLALGCTKPVFGVEISKMLKGFRGLLFIFKELTAWCTLITCLVHICYLSSIFLMVNTPKGKTSLYLWRRRLEIRL